MGTRRAAVVSEDLPSDHRRRVSEALEADERRADRRRYETLGVLAAAGIATTRLPAVMGSSWTLTAVDALLFAAIVAWVVTGTLARLRDALRDDEGHG